MTGLMGLQEFRRPPVELRIEPQHLQIATLEASTQQDHTVQLKNSGSLPLDIILVQASCACTAVRLDEKRIEPGSSAVLHITVAAGSNQEALSAQISGLFKAAGMSKAYREVIDISGTVVDH